jgi:hypothetical protein
MQRHQLTWLQEELHDLCSRLDNLIVGFFDKLPQSLTISVRVL